MPIDEAEFLALIDRDLSADERRCLLAGALGALDAAARERLLAGLDEDTAETVRDLLEGATEGGPERRSEKPTIPSEASEPPGEKDTRVLRYSAVGALRGTETSLRLDS